MLLPILCSLKLNWYKVDGTPISQFDTGDSVFNWSVYPSKRIIATTSYTTVKLWDFDGSPLVTLPRYSPQSSNSNAVVEFMSNGEGVLVGNGDDTVSYWSFNINDLLSQGCAWLKDYFAANPQYSEQNSEICRNK